MTISAKYFVFNSKGVYIDWSYTLLDGFNVLGREAAVVGSGGSDAMFVGKAPVPMPAV